jgi:hypothetical protein
MRRGDAIPHAQSDDGPDQRSQSHAQCITNAGTERRAECITERKPYGKSLGIAHGLAICIAERGSDSNAQFGTIGGSHRSDSATHFRTIGSALVVAYCKAQ